MQEKIDTKVVIIGAGIAGLCVSYFLTKKNISHLILERGEVANTWINERWENFHLVNPNWAIKIPEFGFGTKFFPSKNPDGFLNKIEIIEYVKSFAKYIGSNIYTDENVSSIDKENNRYKLTTSKRNISSEIVIIASGAFGESYIPKINLDVSSKVFQIHSSEFKDNDQLPEGGVLVVGSGQSGAQIAEDLIDCKRNVWLAVSKCGRRPRTYRGKDSSWWNHKMGLFDKTINDVPFKDRWKCSAHTSGAKGGHDINLMDLASQGLNLCGSVKNCSSEKIVFNDDLFHNLKFSDDSAISWSKNVDNFILENKLDATLDKITPDNRINSKKILSPKSISFAKSIKSIIWSTGFRFNYNWINFKVVDNKGFPIQKRGITKHKGFYFMGLQWMHSSKSAQFIGVAEDAEFIANDITSKK